MTTMPADMTPKTTETSLPFDPSGEAPGYGAIDSYRFPLEFLDTMAIDDSPEWLVKGLMPSQGVLVLYGLPGSGKSFLALDVALHVAAGRSWAGCKVRRAGVVYVASEAGRGMRKRVLAALGHHRLQRALPFALVTVAPDLGQREGDARALADEIKAQVPADFEPGLVIFDTMARSMVGADESGAAGMGLFIANAERLGHELGALVMPIHHMGKDVTRGMRGSSALLAAAEAVWEIPAEEDRCVRVVKMKEDRDAQQVAFSLERVTVGTDRDGDAITTCVVKMGRVKAAPTAVAASDTSPAAVLVRPSQQDGLSKSQAAFLMALVGVIARDGAAPGARAKHIPAHAKIVSRSSLADHPALGIIGSTKKSRRSTLDRHIRALQSLGIIACHGTAVWLTDARVSTKFEEKHAA